MGWAKRSLRHQLIILMLLSLTIPIVLSIFINYRFTKDSLYTQAVEETMGFLSLGGNDIADYIQTVNRSTLSVYSDEDLYHALAGHSSIIGNDFFFSRLSNLFRQVKETRRVYLYSTVRDSSYVVVNGIFKKTAGELRRPDGEVPAYGYTLQGVHDSEDYEMLGPNAQSPPVFTVQRTLYRVPSSEKIGVLAIDVSPEIIDDIFQNLNISFPGDLFLYDASGNVFYESPATAAGETFHDDVNKRIASSDTLSGYLEMRESGFSGMIFYQKIEIAGHILSLVKRISDETLYEKARHITWLNSVIAAVSLAVALIAVVVVSLNISSPILRLTQHMNRIKTGQFGASIRLDRQDEIGLLADRFQSMMDTINDLIRNEYKIKLANQQSEIKSLLAQINPHFMNNALQSIGSAALEANAPQVYKLITSLGQMMDYNMNNNQIFVSLEQETHYVRQYLELQRNRYPNQFRYALEMDPGSLQMMIPKMMLQPVVENYFQHNVLIQDGELVVRASLRDDRLHVTVVDNGIGLSAEKAEQLEAYLNANSGKTSPGGSSIGLLNVMERLRFHYGSEAQIRIQPAHFGGLAVTLSIPATTQRKETAT